MKATRRDYGIAGILAGLVAVILVSAPFQALITTWPGSVVGHLDLLRIWKEILISLMAVPAAWLAWRTPSLRDWLLKSWLARLIYIYAALHGLLGWWAISHHQVTATALIYALIINLRFLAFFLVCLVIAGHKPWLERAWQKLVVWPGMVVIAFGLAQRFLLPYDFLKHFGYGPKTIPAYQTVDANIDYRRIQSTLRGANPLGAYLTVILPALWTYFKKYWRYLAIAASLVVLFYSYSRSAWIGTALTVGLLAYWRSGLRIGRGWLLVGAGVVALAGLGVYGLRSNQSLQETIFHYSQTSKSPTSSNAQRSGAIEAAARDIINQPQGRGPGTAGPASFRNNHPPRIAEDYYLQLGQETGVIGMAIFMAINLLVGWQLWRRRSQSLALLLLASLVGISFINLVSHAWADDTLSLLWWGLAGISLSADIINNKRYGRVQKAA